MNVLELANYLGDKCKDKATLVGYFKSILSIDIKVFDDLSSLKTGWASHYYEDKPIAYPKDSPSGLIANIYPLLTNEQKEILYQDVEQMKASETKPSQPSKKTFNQIITSIREKYARLDSLIRQGSLNTINQEIGQTINLLNEIDLNNGIKYGHKLKEKFEIIQASDGLALRSGVMMDRIEYYLKCLSEIKNMLEICMTDYSLQKISNENTTNNIFIVYGHDLEFKEAIKDKINAFNIEHEGKNYQKVKPVLFDDEFTTGKTIIETLEKQTKKCNYAIILLTADDEGKNKKEPDLKNRARQNVILEWGWFVGTVGRENVLVLVDADDKLELPSDVLGLKWFSKKTWRAELEKFLKHISDNKND